MYKDDGEAASNIDQNILYSNSIPPSTRSQGRGNWPIAGEGDRVVYSKRPFNMMMVTLLQGLVEAKR